MPGGRRIDDRVPRQIAFIPGLPHPRSALDASGSAAISRSLACPPALPAFGPGTRRLRARNAAGWFSAKEPMAARTRKKVGYASSHHGNHLLQLTVPVGWNPL